jgi:hypothetical protein
MKWFNQWLMPVAFAVAGIALFLGWLKPGPAMAPSLRCTLGVVVFLFGLQRFALSRVERRPTRRRFGGTLRRPWEE